MKKKLFIPLFFIGTLCIWLLLPIYNYNIDQWRVLHKDYHYAYERIMINKVYLKVAYLLENKDKYNTLMMGSSRNGSFNVDSIGPKTYNLESSFSGIGTHLHNLKILFKDNVQIKHVWIAINDYDIWKNIHDFENDWGRKTYKYTLIEKVKFYTFYLFKNIDKRDISILKGQNKLVKSERIIEKINKMKMYEHEALIKNNEESWKKKMTHMGAILLGYNDSSYRIDRVVQEIQEIKNLCSHNHASVTFFMYPSFYKTYISYNQTKIEEFKRKLVTVTPFYDFYNLNDTALNELNWFDTSHFNFSTGEYIINTIKKKDLLVNENNIDTRIQHTRESIRNLIDKVLPTKYIFPFHAEIDLSTLQPIFTKNNFINNDINKSKDIKVTVYPKGLHMTFLKDHYRFLVKLLDIKTENIILHLKITSNIKTKFKIYYKKTRDSEYNSKDVFIRPLGIGTNNYNLVIPSEYVKNGLKINLADKKGTYELHSFTIYN